MSKSESEKKIISEWVREIFTPERRFLRRASVNLLLEMRNFDREQYYNFMRMTPELFDHLLEIVGPYITKQKFVREPISAKTRLEVTFAT